MSKEIEFFFDFGSPYSWLAMVRLPSVAKAAGAKIAYRPVSLLRLMPLANNRPTTLESRNKARYANKDLARWADLYKVNRARNPALKTMPLDPLLTGALIAMKQGRAEAYVSTVFDAIYSRGLDMGNPAIFIETLTTVGLDGAAIVRDRDDPTLLKDIERRTVEAAERGLFGVPSFIVGENLFFGNDRLDFVETALSELAPAD
jgi:2-hydroxychromene-2-carboxylate isomerase